MKSIPKLLYVLLLLSQMVICFLRPYHNWDMLGYMGCTISIEEKNIDSIHAKTFRAAKLELPAKDFETLTQSNEYRKKNFSDAGFFHDQLKLYWVKPLYVVFIFLLYRGGVPLALATLIPSLFSLVSMGLLLFYWMSKYQTKELSILLSSLVILVPPFWDVGRYATPDALAGLVVLLAFYFLIEKQKSGITIVLLILSIFIRIDLALLALMTLGLLHFTKQEPAKISGRAAIISGIIAATIVIVISVFTDNFGANLFVNYNLEENPQAVSNYGERLISFLPQLRYSHLTIFLTIILLSLTRSNGWKKWRTDFSLQVTAMCVLYIFIRYLIFPNLEDRFFIAEYLFFCIIAVKYSSQKKMTSEPKSRINSE